MDLILNCGEALKLILRLLNIEKLLFSQKTALLYPIQNPSINVGEDFSFPFTKIQNISSKIQSRDPGNFQWLEVHYKTFQYLQDPEMLRQVQ